MDKLGITTKQSPPIKCNKTSIVACISFFLLLCTWLSIPYGGSGDMDFHMASIWCAQGEKEGLCVNIDRAGSTAEVPFMFQMCDGRNIDWWPYCEIEPENPSTQRLRMASPEKSSLYYKIVHFFVDEKITSSVLKIRLFNSLLSSIVLFLLLSVTTKRARFAAVAGLTFSFIPYGPQLFSGVTTRGWAILGVMTSWAFLDSYLDTPREVVKLRRLQLSAYMFTVFLVLATRIDALFMVVITSLIVISIHLIFTTPMKSKRLVLGVSIFGSTAIIAQFVPLVRNLSNFRSPSSFGVSQYWLFQIVHIPEFVADWWSYNIGQSGSGPGVIGLIGVTLFAINLAFAMQKSDLIQRLLVSSFSVIVFVLLAKSSSVVESLVPLSGFYTLGLAAPWLGLAIANSNNQLQFMTTRGNRFTAVLLLSFSHSVYFYSLLEFYTKRGKNTGFFEATSLNGEWWWNIVIGPNLVFLFGVILFPVFLTTMWRVISTEFPE